MTSSAGYLDSHLHLQKNVDTLLEGAKRGVQRMFCNATREADWQTVIDLAVGNKEVIPFLGIHPWFAETAGPGWEQRLMSRLQQNRAGIGEIGLDRRCRADFSRQQQIFLTQLQLASALRRPVVIHCVKAWGALLEILEPFAASKRLPPAMIHSYGGSQETLRRLLKAGCFISYSCRIMAEAKLQPCFLDTPPDKLLLETDAPGQAQKPPTTDADNPSPECHEPAAIIRLYAWAAATRGIEQQKFNQRIWSNGEIFADTILPR
jgi:TatD DNase family protein